MIGSAVFAHLTTESPYTLQWAPLFLIIVPSHEDLDRHLTHDSLGPSERTSPTASWSVQLFLHRWPQSVPILYSGAPLPLPLPIGDLDSVYYMVPWPTRVLKLNGISIGSAVSTRLTSVTDRQTDRSRSLCNNRPRCQI